MLPSRAKQTIKRGMSEGEQFIFPGTVVEGKAHKARKLLLIRTELAFHM